MATRKSKAKSKARNKRRAATEPQAKAGDGRASVADGVAADTAAPSGFRFLAAPLTSAILLWAAFQPLGFAILGWLAPLGWLHVVESHREESEGKASQPRPLPLGWRRYFWLWVSGAVFWLATLQGIRLAYWPLYAGWMALALFLAIYTPLFVASTRILRKWHVPLVVAAPVSWVGIELIRSYILTGFSANTLAHTQVHFTTIIQIADQLGGYGVSLLMMVVCVAIYELGQSVRSRNAQGRNWHAGWSLALALVLFAGAYFYGRWRLDEADQLYAERTPLVRVLLVQENMPTVFDADLSAVRAAWSRYLETTRSLVAQHGSVDVVVWPESTFTGGNPWVDRAPQQKIPQELIKEGLDLEFVQSWVEKSTREFEFKTRLLIEAATPIDESSENDAAPYLVLGSDAVVIEPDRMRRHNAALFVGPDGKLIRRYDKMHLVMIGEYMPLRPVLGWLADMFGVSAFNAGQQPQCFAAGDVNISPSICFETMMPRVIRNHVSVLKEQGDAPDLLINVTNDSWFRGSSMLDHHLDCAILCAVENRRPLLVAANSGMTAEIDGAGRLVQQIPRFEIGGCLAQPKADGRWGLVQNWGYPIAWFCTLVVIISFLGDKLFPTGFRRT